MWQLLLDGDKAEAERVAALWGDSEHPPADATSFFETGTPGLWRAEALYQDEMDAKAALDLLDTGIRTRATLAPLADRDWVGLSLQGLPAVRAGGFVIHGAHNADAAKPGETAILIEAGQAFGTGHHGTTQGCLEAIGRLLTTHRPANALDIGCGSGVLAMAVAKRAAIPVTACDLDPTSVEIAGKNARANACPPIRFVTADGTDHPVIRAGAPYDLVLANILKEPLIALAPDIRAVAAPGGWIVLSGLLTTHEKDVIAAYEAQGFDLNDTLRRGEWSTLLFSA